ncbi:hypothetical protein [Paenibacillus xylanexedens]|uniref:hypothetical protein n=1 Tax=Paenibacillus xylanexedens TaxID=528191 RepID=UPI0011A7848A|nr:hypothetical protein [Paenibacillus xylanexedens]
MISIVDLEDEGQIYSVSRQIEFLMFYDRIKYLVDFYNYSMKCYYDFLEQKHRDRKKIEDNIDEILKSAEDQKIYVTEHEVFISIDEEILGIEMNYLEYQKMTLLIIMYSEVEKLIDNLINLNQPAGNIKTLNDKLRSLCLNKGLNVAEISYMLENFNTLRLIRNKLVHRYDYWDDEIVIDGRSYIGIKQLTDSILEHLVNSITNSIKKLEECY